MRLKAVASGSRIRNSIARSPCPELYSSWYNVYTHRLVVFEQFPSSGFADVYQISTDDVEFTWLSNVIKFDITILIIKWLHAHDFERHLFRLF